MHVNILTVTFAVSIEDLNVRLRKEINLVCAAAAHQVVVLYHSFGSLCP